MMYRKYLYYISATIFMTMACTKEWKYHEDAGDRESYMLLDSIRGHAYVFTKAEDSRGRDLLKLNPCMADDTFHMNFYPYGMGPSYSVLIKQGTLYCNPQTGDIRKAEWGLASNFTDEREVCLSFPFPYTTAVKDTSGTTIGYNYYSPVHFFKYLNERNRFTYDSSFTIQLFKKTDSTEEHYTLSRIPDSLWINTDPE